jgi:hypothetical protein
MAKLLCIDCVFKRSFNDQTNEKHDGNFEWGQAKPRSKQTKLLLQMLVCYLGYIINAGCNDPAI